MINYNLGWLKNSSHHLMNLKGAIQNQSQDPGLRCLEEDAPSRCRKIWKHKESLESTEILTRSTLPKRVDVTWKKPSV